MDIFFFEAFTEEAEQIKRFLPPDLDAGFTGDTIQEYGQEEMPAPIISIRTQSIIPLDWASKLSGILSRSSGFDHILKYLNDCLVDIPCGYLPTYCRRGVAEQAMLLWLALLRKLPQQINSFSSFNRDGLTGRECLGKTLLVVGVGNIGYEIVSLGRALGMQTLGVDIVQRYSDVDYVDIQDGIGVADVIVSAMNLMPENTGYFSYELLKNAKPNAVFVNVARGELSPVGDLIRLLEEKRLAGVALDVYSHENLLAVSLRSGKKCDDKEVCDIHKLAAFPQTILTPHNAFNTSEGVERKAQQSVEQAIYFIKNGTFIWPVPI
jgi:D-lactate dehydrogenase